MSEPFYSGPYGPDPENWPEHWAIQAKQRFRRGHVAQPVVIIDMLDKSAMGELLAKRQAARFDALKPFIQGMSAQLTPAPPLLLEYTQERPNLPHG